MEKNNYDYRDEIIEYPENYEEIANLALLNFEKNCKFDLNKLIKKGLNSEEININEKDNIENNNNNILENKKDEWEDYSSDNEDENEEEQNNKFNNYQAFEDENEEEDKIEDDSNNQSRKVDKINEKIKDNENKFLYSKIESFQKKEDINNINNNDIEKEEKNNIKDNNNMIKINLKEKNKNKTQKLNNKEIKEKISKIKYTPPNWAINMKDEDFIKNVQKFINKK